MAVVLGLSFFYHDSAAALAVDGRVVAAVAEERLCRRKHTAEFPKRAVEYCLERAGLRSINELDAVVFYEKPLRKLVRALEVSIATWPRSARRFASSLPHFLESKVNVRKVILEHYPRYEGHLLFNEHHLSHAASAFFPSPFEEAAIMTLDGVGEWETTAVGHGTGNRIRLDESLRYPHSIGLFYSALTAYLGFRVNDGEWKVMGLAPYGEPRYRDALQRLVRRRDDGSFRLDLRYFTHHWSSRRSFHPRRWQALLGFPPRRPNAPLEAHHQDLARSGQELAEALILGVARRARARSASRKLVVAGGVGLNSVANWAIEREGLFEKVWIQPAAGDDGGALGAALYVAHQILGDPRQPQRDAYLGPEFGEAETLGFLVGRDVPFERLDDAALVENAARAIAAGEVVGWFQGRMEFGPRALGNRSILAAATHPEMKRILNEKVKFRETFRPFAPAVPLERVHEYFEVEPGTELPFMLKVRRVRPEVRARLPAITHEDGTGRVQTVSRDANPLFHALLTRVGELMGVPVVVNTSFNARGEPIVCTPWDAYHCFVHSGIDTLFLGRFQVTRKPETRLDGFGQEQSDRLVARLDRFDEDLAIEGVAERLEGPVIGSHDPGRVLEFYRALPFNFLSNATDASRALMRRNPIRAHPDLHRLLAAGEGLRVLDVGCGAGWFANACAHFHAQRATGFDFNPVAIQQARAVARLIAHPEAVDFFVGDVFEVELEPRFDLINSLGVLHHTRDCHAAIRRCMAWLRPGGHLHLGLYHARGRQPFLDHFRGLQERGASVEEQFAEFQSLRFPAEDRVHLYSWFRDQVLHPHETQHDFAEVADLLEAGGLEVLSTSLNRFRPIRSRVEIEAREAALERHARRKLAAKEYIPGFFTVLAIRRESAR